MVALFLAILNRNYICINLYDEVRRLVYNFFIIINVTLTRFIAFIPLSHQADDVEISHYVSFVYKLFIFG